MSLPGEYQERISYKIGSIHDIGSKCWEELVSIMSLKHLQKQDHYSREGQYAGEIGFVMKGVLRLYYLDEYGEEWNKHFFTPDDLFAASIDPRQKSIASVQALTDVEFVSIDRNEWVRLSEKYRQLDQLLKKLTDRYLASKQEREIILLSENADRKYLKFKEKFPELEQVVPQYHIASYLGITPTQLSRVRRKIL